MSNIVFDGHKIIKLSIGDQRNGLEALAKTLREKSRYNLMSGNSGLSFRMSERVLKLKLI
jgi:hypothetical protein